jgi:DNA polymerase-3 subunit epsilon
MENKEWVILDTETTGLFDPIYVIEIAAQRMCGWEPVGVPFHAYLNHGVPVPPEATEVNGITTEFLEENGKDPRGVHVAFRDFLGGMPVIAHNLSYDWDRCLLPEWERMSIQGAGSKGFCSMLLGRRVLPETKSVKLDVLRDLFGIDAKEAHTALGDTDAVKTLLCDVYRPRLQSAGIITFDDIVSFSRETPIKKCHARISTETGAGKKEAKTSDSKPKDEWYFLDSESVVHGPFPANYIMELSGGTACFVWREGITDWTISTEDPWFGKLSSEPPEPIRPKYKADKSMGELIGLCRGILADDKVTNKEVYQLSEWLEECPFLDTWPASEISQEVEKILEDGIVTKEEKEHLGKLLSQIMDD